MCRTGCPTPGAHDSWGACARDANLQIDKFALAGNNQPAEKAKNHTLNRYREAREAGFKPDGCMKSDMDKFDASFEKKPKQVTND